MKWVIVDNAFDSALNQPSQLAASLAAAIQLHSVVATVAVLNGTTATRHSAMVSRDVSFRAADVVLWLALEDPLSREAFCQLKVTQPSCICVAVSTATNAEANSASLKLSNWPAAHHADLILEIQGSEVEAAMRLRDSLGNDFVNSDDTLAVAVSRLLRRSLELRQLTQAPSSSVGEAILAPKIDDFFERSRQFGEIFQALEMCSASIGHTGSVSFRCDRGFPSIRLGQRIFVTGQNQDLRQLCQADFIALDTFLSRNNALRVYGQRLPAPEAAAQVWLYSLFPSINFMVHSHAYVDDAPFTDRPLPCWSLEAVDDILAVRRRRSSTKFAINLRGHGSLLFAGTPRQLDGWTFVPRVGFDSLDGPSNQQKVA